MASNSSPQQLQLLHQGYNGTGHQNGIRSLLQWPGLFPFLASTSCCLSSFPFLLRSHFFQVQRFTPSWLAQLPPNSTIRAMQAGTSTTILREAWKTPGLEQGLSYIGLCLSNNPATSDPLVYIKGTKISCILNYNYRAQGM